MTVYVIREGTVVEKTSIREAAAVRRSSLPSPMLSPRLESFESPVTGKAITSWRDRDRDMAAVDAVDPRDIPKAAFEKRKRIVERNARSEPA
jgi:hypothetical protein